MCSITALPGPRRSAATASCTAACSPPATAPARAFPFGWTPSSTSSPNVLLWTAQSCKKVKNPKDYLPESEKNKSGKGRKKNKKEKEKEPVKIWTQEETVRGIVLVKNDKVYIKEERLGRKDKGLEVYSGEWFDKLKELPNQKVVLHGITHRTGIASGTFEVHNALKVYPK